MSNVQKKLFNYSEAPPLSAWEGIAAQLEETPAYATKLYYFEQQPDKAVWQKVAIGLSTPEAKVIPLRTQLFKKAIAAAVLLAVAAGSIFYLTHTTAPNLASESQRGVAADNRNTSSDSQRRNGNKNAVSQNIIIKETGKITAENEISDGAVVHFSPVVRITNRRITARQMRIVPHGKTLINTELSNRYMIATTAAGNAVRLPKKAYSDYACAEALNDRQCKEKIASIQSKMAASVNSDFTDFLDLLKKLQDN